MNLQMIESADGKSHQVVFAPGRNVRKIAKNLREEGGEKLVGFISLESDDPAIKAFAAIGTLAVEADRARGNVPLEMLLHEIFMVGYNAGKKGKNERKLLK